MYRLKTQSALAVYWEDLVFLEASLLAVPETSGLAGPVTAHLAELEAVEAHDKTTMRELVQARARASVTDAVLDDGVREVQADLLYLVRQDRKDQRYAMMFKKGLSRSISTASLPNQITEVQRIVGVLELPVYENDFRNRQKERLEPIVERGQNALAASRAAEQGRVVNRIQINDWKDRANAIRMEVYGNLVILAAEKGKSKKWVRSFFPTTNAKSKQKAAPKTEETSTDTGE